MSVAKETDCAYLVACFVHNHGSYRWAERCAVFLSLETLERKRHEENAVLA